MTAITLNLEDVVELTEEQFYKLCQSNRDVRLERTAAGDLIVMPPTGWETGKRNSKLTQRLGNWTDQDGTGLAFDSSTGFTLPNGANRSPDAAWVNLARLESIAPDPQKFLPLAPDFAAELRSSSDSLPKLQAKMREYIDNGTRLGWLLNPQDCEVEIYRPGQAVEMLKSPISLSGEDVLPAFTLELKGILFSLFQNNKPYDHRTSTTTAETRPTSY